MHPTISYQLAQARIADLRLNAQRANLARAARRARTVRRRHAAPSLPALSRVAAWRARKQAPSSLVLRNSLSEEKS